MKPFCQGLALLLQLNGSSPKQIVQLLVLFPESAELEHQVGVFFDNTITEPGVDGFTAELLVCLWAWRPPFTELSMTVSKETVYSV